MQVLDRQGQKDITVGEAQQEGKSSRDRSLGAALATTGEVLAGDGSINPGNAPQFATHSQAARAKENEVSKRQQEMLDALARKSPELLGRVRTGDLSVHRACIEAGISKEPTALEVAQKAYLKLDKPGGQFCEWLAPKRHQGRVRHG